MADPKSDPLKDVRKFSMVLAALGDGTADPDVMSHFLKVAESVRADAVRRSGKSKKGTLTLTVDLVSDVGGTLTIEYSVETKTPKPPRRTSTWWATEDGRLSFKHPRQEELPFTVVTGGATSPAVDLGQQQSAQEV